MSELKKVLDSADMYIQEFAEIMQVHRITVHRWMRGGYVRQAMTKKSLEMLTRLIEKAVAGGHLPLKEEITAKERLPAIKRALRKANEDA